MHAVREVLLICFPYSMVATQAIWSGSLAHEGKSAYMYTKETTTKFVLVRSERCSDSLRGMVAVLRFHKV